MKLGFKIEIGSNIYKLPGRISSQIQLLDQIESNFKDRVPLNYSITFQLSESSKAINLNDQKAFVKLQAYAAENNLKCIKLKVVGSQQNSQKEDTVTNWCKLIDGFCEDQQDNNIIHYNINDDRFPEFTFENGNNEEKQEPFQDSFECEDGFIFSQQQWKHNSNSKAIKLDESAIIFIRSEDCTFLTLEGNSKETQNEHLNGKNTKYDHQIQLQQSVSVKTKILEQTEPQLQNCAFEQGQNFLNLGSPLLNQCVSNSSSQPFPSNLHPLKQKFSSLDPPTRSNKLPNRHSLNPAKSPSKLTSSVYFDQGNQSTADHSQGSFVSLNASNLSSKIPLQRPIIVGNRFVVENKFVNKVKSDKLNMVSSQGLNSPCSILSQSPCYPIASAENSPYKRSNLKNNSQLFSLDRSNTQFRLDQNQIESKQQGSISLLQGETHQNAPVKHNNNFLIIKQNKNATPSLIFKGLKAVEQGRIETDPQNILDSQKTIENKSLYFGSQERDLNNLASNIANHNFKAKIIQSPNQSIQVKEGELISIHLKLQNTGENRWPSNLKLHCIEGFAEGNNFQIESVEPLSSASVSIKYQVPVGQSVIKNQFRLCYEAEKNNLKYFGPKINFQLEVIESIINNNLKQEISNDNLLHSNPLNFQKNSRINNNNNLLC